MDASIEMKFLHLKRLIEIRSQLIAVQEDLNVDCGLLDSIIIHSKEEFWGYAKLIGVEPNLSEKAGTSVRCVITYKGLEIVAYMSKEEYQHYTEELRKEEQGMFIGIGPEDGKKIEEDFALGYAMQRVMQSKEEQKEFVEWFFSGNWVKKDDELRV